MGLVVGVFKVYKEGLALRRATADLIERRHLGQGGPMCARVGTPYRDLATNRASYMGQASRWSHGKVHDGPMAS